MSKLLSLLAGIMLLLSGAAESSETIDDSAALGSFIDGMVQPLMKDHNSPSGAVVIMKGGRVILARGYGYQDIAQQIPVDVYSTLFRPGSVSKLFTWVAVMQQVERGHLDLDVDVNTYLSSFKIKPTFDQPVTLRHLMTHTPGFEDGGMGYLIIEDPDKALPLRESMLRYQPLRVNPPGTQTAYSNYGAALAGLIVANVSGQSFTDYIKQHIFDPLGMRDATFVQPLPHNLQDQMANSYAVENGAYVAQPFEIITGFAPAGGMSVSATEMAKFALAIMNGGEYGGGRILQTSSVKQMLTRQFSHDERMMGMALGFYETERNGIRLTGHDGDTAWFHSELVMDADNDLAYFVTFGGIGGGSVRSVFKSGFYDHYFPLYEAPPVPSAGFSDRAASFTGSYWLWRSNFSGIEKALGMADEFQVTATADNTLVVDIGGASKQYAEIAPLLFRELDTNFTFEDGMSPRLIAFQQDEAGEVTGFVMDEWPFMSFRKKPTYETMHFLKPAVRYCYIVFGGFLLLAFYRRKTLRWRSDTERQAWRAAIITSLAFWLLLLAGSWVMNKVGGQLRAEVPMLFKLSLVLPVLAVLASANLLYHCLKAWLNVRAGTLLKRLAITLVCAGALFMCWFLYFWNILGWQLPG